MTTLATNWNGHVYGTNTGKFTLELTHIDAYNVEGKLRFNDDNNVGIVVYAIKGEVLPSITLEGIVETNPTGLDVGKLTIKCKLTPEGNLEGEWYTTIETGGTFKAFPHSSSLATINKIQPEQIHIKRKELGFIQIYDNEFKELVDFLITKLPSSKPVITVVVDSNTETSHYYSDFLESNKNSKYNYLKIFLSEPDSANYARSIMVELREHGVNDLRTQGPNESWVHGTAEIAANYMKRHSDGVRSYLHFFVPSLIALIFFIAVILISETYSIPIKVGIALITIIITTVVPVIVSKLLPRAIIRFGDNKSTWLRKVFQKGGNWILAMSGLILFAIANIFWKYLHDFLNEYFPFIY